MRRRRLPAGVYRGSPVVGHLTFPAAPLGVMVELALGADLTAIPGTWVYTDVTQYVLVRDGITMSAGRSDDASQAEPGRITLSVSNADGRWSSAHPLSPWYGLLDIGTPIRISVDPGTGYRVLATGFITSLPPRWDKSGNDRWVPIEAYGHLARLAIGTSPALSAMTATALAYEPVELWPGEDGESATSLSSANGGAAMTVTGTVSMADTAPTVGTGPLPTFASGSKAIATVRPYTHEGVWMSTVMVKIPSAPPSLMPLAEWQCDAGTLSWWRLDLDPSTTPDQIVLRAFSTAGSVVLAASFPFAADGVTEAYGRGVLLRLDLAQDGPDIQYAVNSSEFGLAFVTGTLSGQTLGPVRRVILGHATSPAVATLGQLSLYAATSDYATYGPHTAAGPALVTALDGNPTWPGNRVVDVCQTHDIPLTLAGVPVDPPSIADRMAGRAAATPLSLLREAELVSDGVLSEIDHGVQFRTRSRSYNRDVTMALDYAQGHVADIVPAYDDLRRRNDVTVRRTAGGSSRAEADASTIRGQGRRDTAITLPLETEEYLSVQAGWRLHRLNSGGLRIVRLGLNLAATPELADQWIRCVIGSRITITHPPDDLPPDDVDLIVEGWTQTIGPYQWDAVINTSPARPWTVHTIGHPVRGRLALRDSTLASGVTTTATSLSIATGTLPLLVTSTAKPDRFPFDVDLRGERVTVTAITGASSPQTATVIRSVNGIVKDHPAGTEVQLWQPAVIAL